MNGKCYDRNCAVENVGYLIPLFTAVIFVNLRGIFSDGAPKKVRQK